ncbi:MULTISPECIES: TssN family type VI secretion system protein [unclassified Chryseobacterium]|uniref:TssN family type VI secretion system protein n=1 Tax=unclassified Chryseobacterium TaxID=2593645 RepID=UPI00226A8DF9|nr:MULTISPECIES: TssN family type VI secretion system protein [unclassified Chryseobacterium]
MMQLKKYFINLLEPQVLAASVILLAIIIILTMIFSQKTSEFKQKYKAKFYIYCFSMAFVYSVIAFLGYNKLFLDNNLYEFIFYQISSLLMGIIHCIMYRSYFNKFGDNNSGKEYLFALLTITYSVIPFMLIYTFLNGVDFMFLMLGHYIIFFIPTFLNDTFTKAMAIPPKIYKTWKFPDDYEQDSGLEEHEWRNTVLLTYMMDKDKNATKYGVYRAKGPTRIDFGRLFYNFIMDYNDKHPDDEIQIKDENGLFNWVFFLQPKWYESTKYIDPELTLYMNGIEENSVIFCMRTEQVMGQDKSRDKKDADYEYTKEKDGANTQKSKEKAKDEKEVITEDVHYEP